MERNGPYARKSSAATALPAYTLGAGAREILINTERRVRLPL